MNNNYMELSFSGKVRRAYEMGRVRIVISLTPSVHQALGKVGAIRLRKGAKGLVAQKGGFGSGFIELSLRLLLRSLSKDDDSIGTPQELAVQVRGIIADPEDVERVRANLRRIADLL